MRIALSVLAATLIPHAEALTLSQALTLALDNEPTFLAAKAAAAASRERNRQAFAGMLPLVSASVATNSDRRSYLTRGSVLPTANDNFNSNTQQVTLTQPLWRHANLIAVKQSESVVSQNEYLLAAAQQDLYAKLIAAWCDTMFARDVISFNQRQVATALQQLKAQQHGLSLGIVSAPALEEARTKYEQARSDEAISEADMNVKVAQLEQLVGPIQSFTPPFLSSRFADLNLGWLRIDEWLDAIETTSPTILAAERNLEAAGEEVKKQRAGHEATLDLVVSYNHNGQSVGNFPGQDGYDIRQGAVGLQLSVPIYSGGGQSAKTAEAVDLKEKARQELEGARRTARLAAKQAWYGLQAALLRSTAAQQARRFWTVVLQAAAKGQASGTNTEVEILQARQQLEGTKRDLNKARYDMITLYFRLHAAAGELNEADIKALQDFMVPEDEMAQETQTAAGK